MGNHPRLWLASQAQHGTLRYFCIPAALSHQAITTYSSKAQRAAGILCVGARETSVSFWAFIGRKAFRFPPDLAAFPLAFGRTKQIFNPREKLGMRFS
jgi:hypothetical protein